MAMCCGSLRRRRRQVRLQTMRRYGQQGVHIFVPLSGAADHFGVHGLLARQLNLRERQPHAGVKPSDGPNSLFAQDKEPIAAFDVDQFVVLNYRESRAG